MNADTSQKLQDDLNFVRGAVEELQKRRYGSIALAALWAVIIGVGFTLNDFNQRAAGWFWMIGPFVGFFLSGWIGYRAELMSGAESRDGWKHGLHWGSIFVLCGAVLSIALVRELDGEVVGQLFTLITGAVYFLGGVHLDRRFLWPGVLLVIGSAAIDYIHPYPWTVVGIATAVALVASALWMKPKHDEAQTIG